MEKVKIEVGQMMIFSIVYIDDDYSKTEVIEDALFECEQNRGNGFCDPMDDFGRSLKFSIKSKSKNKSRDSIIQFHINTDDIEIEANLNKCLSQKYFSLYKGSPNYPPYIVCKKEYIDEARIIMLREYILNGNHNEISRNVVSVKEQLKRLCPSAKDIMLVKYENALAAAHKNKDIVIEKANRSIEYWKNQIHNFKNKQNDN